MMFVGLYWQKINNYNARLLVQNNYQKFKKIMIFEFFTLY